MPATAVLDGRPAVALEVGNAYLDGSSALCFAPGCHAIAVDGVANWTLGSRYWPWDARVDGDGPFALRGSRLRVDEHERVRLGTSKLKAQFNRAPPRPCEPFPLRPTRTIVARP